VTEVFSAKADLSAAWFSSGSNFNAARRNTLMAIGSIWKMQMGGSFGLQPALRAGVVFHILVVDDDRDGADLLRRVMKNLRGRYELHFVWDGVDALDFLRHRGLHADAPRPSLVLLDINMPRMGGLETLSAIKSDPALYVIPVIMLSTSNSSDDVRKSYEARANCFVQKPLDLERSVKLLQAIETFWMDFVLLPTGNERALKNGPKITGGEKQRDA
jgi:CheY-like chemotaxis protein